MMAPPPISQVELTLKRSSSTSDSQGDQDRQRVDQRGAPDLQGDGGHQPQGGGVDPVQQRAQPGRAAQARDERVARCAT